MFSLIIPVYNRPDEIDELLQSLSDMDYSNKFEVVIVEDGSTVPCEQVAKKYTNVLDISYYYKENSGPGDSRNFGMKKAKGDYYIIFDSDCIIPNNYLNEVEKALTNNYIDCFGGPDKALDSFSNVQKAINFAMTSFLTTGGIRGGTEKVNKFQARSFNMGLSKKAFEATGGFGNIHPGEDPDLVLRLWEMGFETELFPAAYVYHKRRIDWKRFSLQMTKLGKARPILNSKYPKYNKLTFFFPTVFLAGLVFSLGLIFFSSYTLIYIYLFYFSLIFITSTAQNKSFIIGLLSVIAVWKQFYSYGTGFLKSYLYIVVLKRNPEKTFPELYFKKKLPKIIGLTGGIGSGKTTVAKIFQNLGVPVFIADDEARKIMEQEDILINIRKTFGNTVFENNKLNRPKLAEIVFNDAEKLKVLNSIIHPAVNIRFDEWLEEQKEYPFVIYEVAILFENGFYKKCFKTISVIADLDERIERVIKRDNTTKEKILQRMQFQCSDEEKILRSDFIVKNSEIHNVNSTVEDIHNQIKCEISYTFR